MGVVAVRVTAHGARCARRCSGPLAFESKGTMHQPLGVGSSSDLPLGAFESQQSREEGQNRALEFCSKIVVIAVRRHG